MAETPIQIDQIKANQEKVLVKYSGYDKVEIPENLENRNIVGTAYLTNQNGEKTSVFISDVGTKKLKEYGHQADGGLESDLGYELLNEKGEVYGKLALSLKHTSQNPEMKIGAENTKQPIPENINYVSIDWIDTKGCPENIKGGGNLLYQIAMEISFDKNCGGSLHLRSVSESTGFHYLQGATTYMGDRYKKIGEDEEIGTRTYVKVNEIDKISKLVKIPDSLQQDQLMRSDLQANEQRYDREGHPFSMPNPNSLLPMRMSEHSGLSYEKVEETIFDKTGTDDEDTAKMLSYIEWLNNRGKIPKNKMWWIKQIETNPILQSVREGFTNEKIILD